MEAATATTAPLPVAEAQEAERGTKYMILAETTLDNLEVIGFVTTPNGPKAAVRQHFKVQGTEPSDDTAYVAVPASNWHVFRKAPPPPRPDWSLVDDEG